MCGLFRTRCVGTHGGHAKKKKEEVVAGLKGIVVNEFERDSRGAGVAVCNAGRQGFRPGKDELRYLKFAQAHHGRARRINGLERWMEKIKR